MSRIPGLRRLFRLPTSQRAIARDVEEELRFHLDTHVEALVAQGLSPEAARAEAMRRFGDLRAARDEIGAIDRRRVRRVHRGEWLDALRQDVRYAARGLRREPGFALVVVLTLALGIGANAAMFGVLDRLLLRGPAHVVDAGAIRRVYVTGGGRGEEPTTESIFPYAAYTDLRDGVPGFAHLAAQTTPQDEMLGRGVDAERVRVRYATASLFPLLGVRPALGRFFDVTEDTPPRGRDVAVLDHGTWERRYGGDTAVLGRTLVLEGRPVTIVGIAPRGFTGTEMEPVDLWMPISAQSPPPIPEWTTSRAASWISIVGRLRPGAAAAQVEAAATAAHGRGWKALALGTWQETAPVTVRPLWFDRDGNEALEVSVARWLQGVAAVVLLIGCANVANLLLARGARRRREVAVRVALGVGRGRLLRLLLTEGVLLALLGGAAGLLLAWAGGLLLRATLLGGVGWDGPPVDGRVLLFTLAVTSLVGVLVPVLPALRAASTELVTSLKAGTAQAGSARSRLRGALTVAQAALSMVLLVGAGLFVQSLWKVRHLDLGIDAERLYVVEPSRDAMDALPEEARSAEQARRRAFLPAAAERLRGIPGVAATTLGTGTPLYSAWFSSPRVDGRDSLPVLPGGGPYMTMVRPDYFAAVGTRIVRGRAFEDAEGAATHVAVVSATMARTLWPAGDAIGKCLYVDADTAPCSRIVGVAQDVHRFAVREEPALHFYMPLAARPRISPTLLVRITGDPAVVIPAIRQELQALDPTLRTADVRSLMERVSPQMRPWQLGATLFGVFGALALLVAAVGLYSVMAYAAAQRTHEMGVRLALGARPADVRRAILRSGVALGALGVALGALGALAAGRWVEPLLFQTPAAHPGVLGGVTAALLAVAVLASVVPAARAARTAPSVALRVD